MGTFNYSFRELCVSCHFFPVFALVIPILSYSDVAKVSLTFSCLTMTARGWYFVTSLLYNFRKKSNVLDKPLSKKLIINFTINISHWQGEMFTYLK